MQVPDNIFEMLTQRYGISAASTYYGAREFHGATVSTALTMARTQYNDLGPTVKNYWPVAEKYRGKSNVARFATTMGVIDLRKKGN